MGEFIKLVIKFTLILFVLVGIVFGSVIAYSKISGKEINELSNGLFGEEEKEEPKFVLVAGLHPDGPLTDFIMLAKYNPETGSVNAMSIPRDTKVVGTVDGKINSAYARKRDINSLADKVKDLTGITVENYVLFDTGTVRKMVDAIGGIPMDIPIDMKYDDNEQDLHIDLKKGYQVLDGKKAEQFIRFRKNNDGSGYPLGDVQRIEAQQNFIKAAISEVLKPSTLLKLGDLIKLGLESVKTDITLAEIFGYIDDVKNFDMNNLRIETLPGEGMYIGPTSYYVHDSEATKKLVDEMFINDELYVDNSEDNDKPVVSENVKVIKEKSEIKVEVLNGTSRNGLANSVATKLKEEGYNVTKIGNNGNTDSIKTSIINRTEENYAKDIKSFLGKGAIKTEIESDSKVDVTVILGSDY